MRLSPFVALVLFAPALCAAAAPLADLVGRRRVLIAAAPTASDPHLRAQRRAIAGWRRGAAERDLVLVTLAGDAVAGARDDAAALRRRYGLPTTGFTVVLVGKDGHVARRAHRVLAAPALARTIDAMPMRRAGLR